jgi:hypothetical protein
VSASSRQRLADFLFVKFTYSATRQVFDDHGWQSIDCAGMVTARIIRSRNLDIGAPQTELVNVHNRLVAKKIQGAWRVSDRCL